MVRPITDWPGWSRNALAALFGVGLITVGNATSFAVLMRTMKLKGRAQGARPVSAAMMVRPLFRSN